MCVPSYMCAKVCVKSQKAQNTNTQSAITILHLERAPITFIPSSIGIRIYLLWQ